MQSNAFFVLLFLICALRCAQAPPPPRFNLPMFGCNDDNIHQIPGEPDYFVGRIPISADASGHRLPPPGNFGCQTDQTWALGLLQMNFTTQPFTLSFVKLLLWPNAFDASFPTTPIQGGKYVLNSAYDATVVATDAGELWVSFESAGQGFPTSSCAGPLTSGPIEATSLDLSRTSIVVLGTPHAAASVPKLLSLTGSLYLYFDWFLLGPGYLQQMGVAVSIDAQGMMWAMGHSDSMSLNDPDAVLLWRPSPRSSAIDNAIADVFMVTADLGGNSSFVFALGAVGGEGCRAPTVTPAGCYRAAVARSNFPLGEGAFQELQLDPNGTILPANAMEYFKAMTVSGGEYGGTPILYGNFFDPRGPPGVQWAEGYSGFPVPAAPAFWTGLPSPCSGSQQPPNWGERAGVCLQSCGALGAGIAGLAGQIQSCARVGMRDVGVAYDTPHCCAPITCGDAAHPSPNWGLKDGLCLPSCGGIGGTAGYDDACSEHDMIDAGAAYDAPFCCMPPFPSVY